MSTYDRIMEQGIAKGIEKGKAEGRAETIMNAFDNGIDFKTIQIITGESIEQIKEILRRNGRKID